MAQRLPLYIHTLRHLRLSQIWCRGKKQAKTAWHGVRKSLAPQPDGYSLGGFQPVWRGLEEGPGLARWLDIGQSFQAVRQLSEGRYRFLNHEVVRDGGPPWHDDSLSRLWRYHLHYFEVVKDLLVSGAELGQRPQGFALFQELAESWIEHNRHRRGDGWHPYPLSLRIVNWIQAARFYQPERTQRPSFDRLLTASLAGQVEILESDLEFDARGNHLFENIRALLWAGVALKGPRAGRWLSRGLSLLEEQLGEQVLADGGHFERTPAYHLRFLQVCLELSLLLNRNGIRNSPLADASQKVLAFTASFFPRGSRIPLFKDTTLDVHAQPSELLAVGALLFDKPEYRREGGFGPWPALAFGRRGQARFDQMRSEAAAPSEQLLAETGYWIHRRSPQGDYLAVDVGDPCPDYLPAHAHADIFNYELHLGGQPAIVDSGVFQYARGDWRNHFRSTRAHNTVEVENRNQSQVWGSFRVAKRGRVSEVHRAGCEGAWLVSARHDGYCRLRQRVMHRRSVLALDRGCWLVVDQLWGRGSVEAVSRIHLCPKAAFEEIDGASWRVSFEHPFQVLTFGFDTCRVRRGEKGERPEGWHSPRFGVLEPTQALCLTRRGQLPLTFGYLISRSQPLGGPIEMTTGDGLISVACSGRSWTLVLSLSAPPRLKCE